MSRDNAIGIDLGTTFSVVAHLDDEGKPRTVQNSEGDLTTPSVVYFHANETIVGKEAIKVALHEPQSIAQFAKRDMGKPQFHKTIHGHKIPPEAIQAVILKKLKDDASLKLNEVKRVVITVPAFFNEPRRKATMDAGRLAGLEVLDIINEPTAAAIAFGVQEGFVTKDGKTKERETILVYDLGGGTFDVTLMEIEGNSYKALATAGDVHLGGIDWDARIVDYVAGEFEKEHGTDPRKDSQALQSLMQESEDAKRALSTRQSATIHFAHDGHRLRTDLTRDKFESLTSDLVQRTIFTASKVLRDGKRSWKDVTRLLLVGGSTRMPMIQQSLESESGLKVDRSLSPDEAVAHGAALYAGFLFKGRPTMDVTNVCSHDLGVLGIEQETGMKRRQVIIPRNSALPTTGASRFVTRRENQKSVKVDVIEGGDASGKNSTAIGKCVVSELPEKLPANTPVVVKFAYATNGRLKVEASVEGIEKKAIMAIERASGLSEQMTQTWTKWIDDGALIQPTAAAANTTTNSDEQPKSVFDQIEDVKLEDSDAGLEFDDDLDDVEFAEEPVEESPSEGSSSDDDSDWSFLE